MKLIIHVFSFFHTMGTTNTYLVGLMLNIGGIPCQVNQSFHHYQSIRLKLLCSKLQVSLHFSENFRSIGQVVFHL